MCCMVVFRCVLVAPIVVIRRKDSLFSRRYCTEDCIVPIIVIVEI